MTSSDAQSPPRRVPPLADAGGAVYFIALSAGLFGFADDVRALTVAHPYVMGFAKFALLATFGECLKTRVVAGRWLPDRFVARVGLWGLLGAWNTAVFPFVDGGVHALAAAHLWPSEPAALWMTGWLNVFGGIAFFIMFTHYWADTMLVEGPVWPWAVLGRPATARWAKIIMIALVVFWTPAHTVTFLLPPALRILCAAYLGIAFGLILSVAAGRPDLAAVRPSAR